MQNIHSPLQAQLVQWLVAPGANVADGDVLVILEAMKMEHEIRATQAGRVGELYFQAGEAVTEGEVLCSLMPVTDAALQPLAPAASTATAPLSKDRADLQKLQARLAFTHDAARPEAVAKRHAMGLRTARENIADRSKAIS